MLSLLEENIAIGATRSNPRLVRLIESKDRHRPMYFGSARISNSFQRGLLHARERAVGPRSPRRGKKKKQKEKKQTSVSTGRNRVGSHDKLPFVPVPRR